MREKEGRRAIDDEEERNDQKKKQTYSRLKCE